jgi:hypothetical protein
MFTKASFVLIVALLIAILMNLRSQQVVQAQGAIEYKVVVTGDLVTPDGKPALPGARDAHFVTAQEVLDEYGKAGWQLVTHSFFPSSRDQLIFMRK